MSDTSESSSDATSADAESPEVKYNPRSKRVKCEKCRKQGKGCTYQDKTLDHESQWVPGTACDNCRKLVDREKQRQLVKKNHSNTKRGSGFEWRCGNIRPERKKVRVASLIRNRVRPQNFVNAHTASHANPFPILGQVPSVPQQHDFESVTLPPSQSGSWPMITNTCSVPVDFSKISPNVSSEYDLRLQLPLSDSQIQSEAGQNLEYNDSLGGQLSFEGHNDPTLEMGIGVDPQTVNQRSSLNAPETRLPTDFDEGLASRPGQANSIQQDMGADNRPGWPHSNETSSGRPPERNIHIPQPQFICNENMTTPPPSLLLGSGIPFTRRRETQPNFPGGQIFSQQWGQSNQQHPLADMASRNPGKATKEFDIGTTASVAPNKAQNKKRKKRKLAAPETIPTPKLCFENIGWSNRKDLTAPSDIFSADKCDTISQRKETEYYRHRTHEALSFNQSQMSTETPTRRRPRFGTTDGSDQQQRATIKTASVIKTRQSFRRVDTYDVRGNNAKVLAGFEKLIRGKAEYDTGNKTLGRDLMMEAQRITKRYLTKLAFSLGKTFHDLEEEGYEIASPESVSEKEFIDQDSHKEKQSTPHGEQIWRLAAIGSNSPPNSRTKLIPTRRQRRVYANWEPIYSHPDGDTDSWGNTGLILAAYHGKNKEFYSMVQDDAWKSRFEEQNNFGETALIVAAWKNNELFVITLLSRGALANGPQVDLKTTALHKAVEFEHEKIVDLLIQHGARCDLKGDDDQETPYDLAERSGNINIKDMLGCRESSRFDVNSQEHQKFLHGTGHGFTATDLTKT